MSALLPSSEIFEQKQIRRLYDDATETWWFSVIDIIQVLIEQPDYQTARKYWNQLKGRLDKEGSQSVTNRHQLISGAKRPNDDSVSQVESAALSTGNRSLPVGSVSYKL